MPITTLPPAGTALLELIRTAADLVDKVEDNPDDDRDVSFALDSLGDIAARWATDQGMS